jgi:hypothetical protein
MGKIQWTGSTGGSKCVVMPKDLATRNKWDVKDDYHINFDCGYAVSPEGDLKPGMAYNALVDGIPVLKELQENGKLDERDKRALARVVQVLETFV